MTRRSGSKNSRGGLFGWLFGRRESAEAPGAAGEGGAPARKDPPVTEPPVTEPPLQTADYGAAAPTTTPEDGKTGGGGAEDEEDELVLGPAFVAPAAEGGDEPRDLGPSGAAARQDREQGGETGAEPGGSDAALPEEEALLARLRAAGVAGAVGKSATEREYELPSEEGAAADPGRGQAAPEPERGGEPELSLLSGEARMAEARMAEARTGEPRTGEERTGEGDLPASHPGPEGREPMEAPVTSRDDETDRKEDPAGSDTEHAAEGVPLFPGVGKDREMADETANETADDTTDDTADDTTDDTAETTAGDTPAEAAGEAARETGAPSGEGETEAESETGSGAESLALTGAETSAEAEFDPQPEPGPEPGEPAAAAAPDAPAMSEETVRRLIREELEGELGERMSANIRRMIREEVSHALLRQR